MSSMRRLLRPRFEIVLPGLLAVALFACGTSGSGGAVQGVPNYFVMPVDPEDGTGLPPAINDPGSAPVDPSQCAPAGIEIAIVDDFEGLKASHSYTYNDSTSEVFPLVAKDWEPPSTTIPFPPQGKNPCGPGSDQSKQAMHFAGVFKDYGAGFGTVLFNHDDTLNKDGMKVPLTNLATFSVLPPARPILYWDGTTPNAKGMVGEPDRPYVLLQSVDLSAWDGITFWARRGAFAGPGFRPGILDRTTADDFNKQLPPDKAACRSIYTQCGCQNLRPCTPWDPAVGPNPTIEEVNASIETLVPGLAGTFCWDPKLDKYPSPDPTLRCGDFACEFHSDTPIPAMTYNPVSQDASELWHRNIGKGEGIGTMTCSKEPYVFKDSTTPSAHYCYRPGIDADPAEKADRCQDGFLAGTLLDTNWRRYMIPFADLRQGSVDKRSPGIDLGMVEALVFAFPGGNLDVWIDDPGFYRKKKK